MNRKLAAIIVIMLVALLALIVVYIGDDSTSKSGERVSFNVSSGSYGLSEVIKNIKTKPYYEGYDAETVKWMESLGNKQVYFGNGSIIIMNNLDALKIPRPPDVTDAYIYDHFTAEVIEKHSLCEKYPTVYYVKDVNFDNHEIVSNGLA
ncbi:MAG: hypothetical protein IK044_00505 [Methanobrevibacter sp.]|nr:hypothetical protein [Methanobrevibacter sp.]